MIHDRCVFGVPVRSVRRWIQRSPAVHGTEAAAVEALLLLGWKIQIPDADTCGCRAAPDSSCWERRWNEGTIIGAETGGTTLGCREVVRGEAASPAGESCGGKSLWSLGHRDPRSQPCEGGRDGRMMMGWPSRLAGGWGRGERSQRLEIQIPLGRDVWTILPQEGWDKDASNASEDSKQKGVETMTKEGPMADGWERFHKIWRWVDGRTDEWMDG